MENIMQELLSVFTPEQLKQIAELAMRLKGRAAERSCDQVLSITFNAKGYPRHFNGTDNSNAIAPKIYKAE